MFIDGMMFGANQLEHGLGQLQLSSASHCRLLYLDTTSFTIIEIVTMSVLDKAFSVKRSFWRLYRWHSKEQKFCHTSYKYCCLCSYFVFRIRSIIICLVVLHRICQSDSNNVTSCALFSFDNRSLFNYISKLVSTWCQSQIFYTLFASKATQRVKWNFFLMKTHQLKK